MEFKVKPEIINSKPVLQRFAATVDLITPFDDKGVNIFHVHRMQHFVTIVA